jgi:hypothetical protein
MRRKRSEAAKEGTERVDLGFCNRGGSCDDPFPDLLPTCRNSIPAMPGAGAGACCSRPIRI